MDSALSLEHVIPIFSANTNQDTALFIPEIGCFVDTGSVVIHVRNHAYPTKKMSTIVVVDISDVFSVHTLPVRSFLLTWPKKK